MSQWEGKSKGTLIGYKIFVFSITHLGLRFAYFILYFVAAYYFLFDAKANNSLRYYYHKRLGYSLGKSFFERYKSYYLFGQTLIDKTAIGSGLRTKFTYEFDGVHILKQLLSEKKGGILISAHVGNFELSEYFFDDLIVDSVIHLVTVDSEVSHIKEYLDSKTQKSKITFIYVKDDLSHIFEINAALAKNELVCFTGDRYFEGSKTMQAKILGKEAKFPAGPFLISSKINAPVAFVYVMKEGTFHYHLYTRRSEAKKRDAQALLESYIAQTEKIVFQYPNQWFNFFNFWK